MNLKTATLIAIIGNILSFTGAQVMRFGNFHSRFESRMTPDLIWCGIGLLSTGSLVIFLFSLYNKQK